ncbi:MAG: hypothetical protein WDA71_03590 [Actinomycetota bacterium]
MDVKSQVGGLVQSGAGIVEAHQSEHGSDRGAWTTCPGCEWEFRPAYTDWACPMCGRQTPREPITVPTLERLSWWFRTGKNGMVMKGGVFILANLALSFFVLWLYLRQ